MKIKLMLVEDHQIVREGIKGLLEDVEDLEIIADAINGKHALEQLDIFLPDVILTDITMPAMDGFELASLVHTKFPDIKLLVLTMHLNELYIKNAFDIGVSGYLPKDISKQELIEAIRTVHGGKQYFNPEVSALLMRSFMENYRYENKTESKQDIDLTKRETEILRLLADGMNSKEIGDKLFISKKTVDNHRLHLLQKLNVKNVAGLIKYAIIHKLI
jgi:DNA-binding NarL/FixJ family response regulator